MSACAREGSACFVSPHISRGRADETAPRRTKRRHATNAETRISLPHSLTKMIVDTASTFVQYARHGTRDISVISSPIGTTSEKSCDLGVLRLFQRARQMRSLGCSRARFARTHAPPSAYASPPRTQPTQEHKVPVRWTAGCPPPAPCSALDIRPLCMSASCGSSHLSLPLTSHVPFPRAAQDGSRVVDMPSSMHLGRRPRHSRRAPSCCQCEL